MTRKPKGVADEVIPVLPEEVPFPDPLSNITWAGMPREEVMDVYKALSAPFPEEAIQRTKKADTKKGYDTTGIGYQWVVNRFNEVLTPWGWRYEYKILNHETGEYRSGQKFHDITAEVKVEIDIPVVPERENGKLCRAHRVCVGGHISTTYGDALKGAITNGLKKTAALLGVGKGAYEGTLDDDALWPEGEREGRKEAPKQSPPKDAPPPERSAPTPAPAPKNGESGKETHQNPQVRAIHALYDRLKIPKADRHAHAEKIINVAVHSFNDLTYEERGTIIGVLNGLVGGRE